jgi:nitrogen fixation protein NifQ
MVENFPHLAAKNDRDMKWKRFLYRQLCEREGIHICPAPSCQVCTDYAKCFAPEV